MHLTANYGHVKTINSLTQISHLDGTASMTPKQEQKAATVYADKFEEEIRNLLNNGTSAIENPNVTFREFAAQWLEKMLRLVNKDQTYSLTYYEKCRHIIDDVYADCGRRSDGYCFCKSRTRSDEYHK